MTTFPDQILHFVWQALELFRESEAMGYILIYDYYPFVLEPLTCGKK